MKRFILPGLAAAAFITGVAAYAQQQEGSPPSGQGGHMLFDLLDANKDGTVTRAEAMAAAEKHFTEADTDHNGILSQSEQDAMHTRMRATMEDAMFKRMDSDGNGQISLEEFKAAHERMRAAMGNHEDGSGMRRGHEGGMGMMGKGRMMQGDVTKAAYLARVQLMFERVDANHDGKITAAERDAARAKMMEMHQHRGHGDHKG